LYLHGSTYHRLVKRLQQDVPEYKTQFNGPKKQPIRRYPCNLFTAQSTANTYTVKIRLIKDKIIPYCCTFCNNTGMWQNKTLVLRLDHINGIRNDHTLNNLRFVCPNCDSQLPTFTGRNTKGKTKYSKFCNCGKTKTLNAPKCVSCARQLSRKIIWPPAIKIYEEIQKGKPFTKLAKELKVSDNAIRKYLSKNNLSITKHKKCNLT
jgi:hypothetical protein